MPEVTFDAVRMASVLGEIIADGREQHAALAAQEPDFPAASAGRDFAAHGQQIAARLAEIHRRGLVRVDTLTTTAQSAVRQFAVATQTDDSSAGALNALQDAATQRGGR